MGVRLSPRAPRVMFPTAGCNPVVSKQVGWIHTRGSIPSLPTTLNRKAEAMKVYVIAKDVNDVPGIKEEHASVEAFKKAVREGNTVVSDDEIVIAGTKIEVTKEQPAPVYKFNHEPLKRKS